MFARLSAFVIWSLVGATAIFWAMRLAASPPQVPAYAVAVGNSAAVRGDLGRLFGVAPRPAAGVQAPAPEASSRFKLVGVMAPRNPAVQAEPGQGVALIAVDGKPAKPYAVGARLDSDLVLQSVGLRTASLGSAQGGRSVVLELPKLPPPHSGVLPPPGVPPAAVPRTSAAPLPMPGAMAPQPPLPALTQSPPPTVAQPAANGLPTPGGLPTQ
jgi:general secretion pathway protein C